MPGRSLRNLFLLMASALACVTLLLGVALVTSVVRSQDTSAQFRSATRSIRAAEELEVALLVTSLQYASFLQTGDRRYERDVRQAEEELQRWLLEAQQSLDTPEEQVALAQLRTSIATMQEQLRFDSPPARGDWERSFAEAFAGAEKLIALNERYAAATVDRAERYRRATLIVAILGIALTFAGVVVIVGFTRRVVYRPVSRLRSALAERAHDPEARMPEGGPLELRAIATDVNQLIDRLAAQRTQQLTFLSSIAHDLRNPMASLRAAAQLAARQEDVPQEKQRERARMILRQVDRLNRLVEDLLDVSRIEAGRFELRKEPGDLRDVVRESVQLFAETSPEHELRAALPDEPVVVSHDGTRIAQVLGNLVSNAIKYSPRGGPVDVRLFRADGEAVLEVEDRGLGIPPDERESIFEPFRRSGGERGEIPGVGLGLSVARRLVRAHDGSIEVESEPGEGSLFRVRLPIA